MNFCQILSNFHFFSSNFISGDKTLHYFIADDFKEIEQATSHNLLKIHSLLTWIRTNLSDLAATKPSIGSTIWDYYKTINESTLRDLENIEQEFAISIFHEVRDKAWTISEAVRHEVYGHLLDPLFYGDALYSLEDQLTALELMADYLDKNPSIISSKPRNQEQSARQYWTDELDMPELWAWMVERSSGYGEFTGITTPEERQLVDNILALTDLNLSSATIASASAWAHKEAAASLQSAIESRQEVTEIRTFIQELKQMIEKNLSGTKGENGNPEVSIPVALGLGGLALGSLGWIILRRIHASMARSQKR